MIGFVVNVFDNQFTVDDMWDRLEAGLLQNEIMRVFNSILNIGGLETAPTTTMLGNWYNKSTFVFKPEKERLQYNNEKGAKFFNFEDYITSLLDNYQNIKREFPYMFEIIVVYLLLIEKDKHLSYEEWFPEINPEIFKELREEILIPNRNLVNDCHPIKYLFREVGIKPFFKGDFFNE